MEHGIEATMCFLPPWFPFWWKRQRPRTHTCAHTQEEVGSGCLEDMWGQPHPEQGSGRAFLGQISET